jgi:hypothetical protein
MALERFDSTHKKGFYMGHFWEKLKEAMKWRVGYEAYKESVKNGTTTMVVDDKDDTHLGIMPLHLVPSAKSLPRPILLGRPKPLR